MPKIGLKLWSVNTDYYYEEARRLYQKGIYDYIELYIVPGSLPTLPIWKNSQIPFIIHAPHFAHDFNLALAEKKQSNLRIYNEVKQFADELKAPYIIFHGGMEGDIRETAAQLASFGESRALLENKPLRVLSQRRCRGYNAQEAAFVMKEARCGLCLDFGHAVCAANSQQLDIYAYIQTFLSLGPAMFHLTDLEDVRSEYDSHLHLGTGSLDLAAVMPFIDRDKCVTLETNKNSKTTLNDFVQDVQNFSVLYAKR